MILRWKGERMKPLAVVFVILLGMAAACQEDSEVKPPVTKADLQIVQRARKILDSPAKWNRKDTRECSPHERQNRASVGTPDERPKQPNNPRSGSLASGTPTEGEKTFSLYCALEEATKEVSGDFKHRGAAISPQQPNSGLAGDPGCRKLVSSSMRSPRTAASMSTA